MQICVGIFLSHSIPFYFTTAADKPQKGDKNKFQHSFTDRRTWNKNNTCCRNPTIRSRRQFRALVERRGQYADVESNEVIALLMMCPCGYHHNIRPPQHQTKNRTTKVIYLKSHLATKYSMGELQFRSASPAPVPKTHWIELIWPTSGTWQELSFSYFQRSSTSTCLNLNGKPKISISPLHNMPLACTSQVNLIISTRS